MRADAVADAVNEAEEPAHGWVPTNGRGSMPFALVHGESLVAAASWALGEAGVRLLDASVRPDRVAAAGRPLVLHDPLCPLTPPDFIAEAVERSRATGRVVVGFRPVTDTVKEHRGPVLGATVDREGLRAVASPVVVPGPLLAALEDLDQDLPDLVAVLAERGPIEWLAAPALGRRVVDPEDLVVLEALSRSRGPGPS